MISAFFQNYCTSEASAVASKNASIQISTYQHRAVIYLHSQRSPYQCGAIQEPKKNQARNCFANAVAAREINSALSVGILASFENETKEVNEPSSLDWLSFASQGFEPTVVCAPATPAAAAHQCC